MTEEETTAAASAAVESVETSILGIALKKMLGALIPEEAKEKESSP